MTPEPSSKVRRARGWHELGIEDKRYSLIRARAYAQARLVRGLLFFIRRVVGFFSGAQQGRMGALAVHEFQGVWDRISLEMHLEFGSRLQMGIPVPKPARQ